MALIQNKNLNIARYRLNVLDDYFKIFLRISHKPKILEDTSIGVTMLSIL